MVIAIATGGYRAVLGALIMAGAASAFAWAGWLGLDQLRTQRNLAQLDELSAQLLQRAELAVDYAVITLGDYAAPSNDLCNASALTALRQQAFARGAIKDIAILAPDGATLCSTAPGHFDHAAGGTAPVAEYASRNALIVLQPSHAEGSGLFRVLWRVGASHAVAATLNIDMLMFDIFPAPLRDHALAEIHVGSADVVARFGTPESAAPADTARVFSAVSDRYPVGVRLAVAEPSFRDWNPWPLAPILTVGALAGALVGGLVVQGLLRPPGPVDALRAAIRDGEIIPFYQPIFELESSRIVGCEVLVRWQKRDGEMVFPDRFIPLAEASGLIVPMTEKLVERALSELQALAAGRPDFKIAFNIDPTHFLETGFLDTLDRIVSRSGVPNARIVLELTERTAFPDMERAITVARQARDRGYRLSLDDTGAGHNGLGHIQDLRPDVIKIDKKFIDAVGAVDSADAIIEVLAKLGARLGAVLVAEGVETADQRSALARAGIAQGQGYLLSRPVPLAVFRQVLEEKEGAARPDRARTDAA